MRSRYSAYVKHDDAYLLRTWHPAGRPEHLDFDPALTWAGLNVIATSAGNLLDDEGTVEFEADYIRHGEPGILHEISRFVRLDKQWVYVGPLDANIV